MQMLSGEVIGTCAAVFASPEVAYFGLYAMLPEYQGKGLGIG